MSYKKNAPDVNVSANIGQYYSNALCRRTAQRKLCGDSTPLSDHRMRQFFDKHKHYNFQVIGSTQKLMGPHSDQR